MSRSRTIRARTPHGATTPRRTRRRSGAIRYLAPLAALLLGGSVVLADQAAAAQGPVALGTADSFAVLAGSGITNTGPTTINGDIGTFPTPTETGFGSITQTGTNHMGDAVTQGAKNDLVAAYNDAAGRTPVTNVPVQLGGSTLLAGVYTSPTFGLTGTLTLDAQGDPNAQFIFQAGSTLITASNSRVLLVNGADPCRVVWQVGSSATFNTGTQFVGDVLAHVSITAQTSATFQGRLLARDGAVTLDTNTITAAGCVVPVAVTTTTTSTTSTTTPGSTTATTLPGGAATIPTTVPGGGAATDQATTDVSGPNTPDVNAPSAPGSPGTPSEGSGAPPTAFPGTPANSPPLARTGMTVAGLLAAAFTLLIVGAAVVRAARREPQTP